MKKKQHFVAYGLHVTTRMVEKYEVLENDPLPVAIRGGPGKPHQYDLAAVIDWVRKE